MIEVDNLLLSATRSEASAVSTASSSVAAKKKQVQQNYQNQRFRHLEAMPRSRLLSGTILLLRFTTMRNFQTGNVSVI